jgi:hypothetical protein
MAELPSHPDEGHSAGRRPMSERVRSGSRWKTVSWMVLAVVVLAALIVLHLTGVLGAEAHS